MKCENYAIALFGKRSLSLISSHLDGKDCVKNDPTFVKGYYRCGSAYVALGQLDLAVKEFKQVCKLLPQDKDARDKYEYTKKEHKYKEFQKCIGYDDKRVEVNLEDMIVEASY